MGETGAQNKDGRENSSAGRLLGGKQEAELDTELNSDPGAAEMESQFNEDDQQLLSEVNCSVTGGGFRAALVRRKNAVLSAVRGWVRVEVTKLLKLALPIVLTLALQQAQLFVSVLFIGHISGEALEIDAISLALSFINVSSLSIAIGLSTASDTLSSQAYGFKNYLRVGVILQRGLLILGLMMFPIWALWLNTESLFLVLHQPECVAKLSSLYIKIFCICLPGFFTYIVIQKYLQTQNVVWPFVLLMAVSNVISAAIHAILIYGARLGFVGAAIALSTVNLLSPVLVIVYIKWRRLHRVTWGGWSWEALHDWGQYLKLGIPGLLMTCLGWWSAEATTFVSGYISETEQAVNGVGFQILQILFMIPLGVSIAVTIRVGNELGAGRPRTAKRVAYVSIGVGVCIALCYIILLQATKNHIGKLFTKDEAVIERVGLLMTVASAWQFTDGIQITISGVFRGVGKQYLAAIINFLCYNVLGLSVGVPLALKANLGTIGLWTGLATGNVIQAIVFVITLMRINWNKESEKAMKCAEGSIGEQQLLEARGDSDVGSTTQTSLSEGDEGLLEMKEMDTLDSVMRCTQSLSVEDNDNDTEQDNSSIDSLEVQPESSSDVEALIPQELVNSSNESKNSKRQKCPLSWNSRLVLFLTRGGSLAIGVAILIAGGVLSQQTPSLVSSYYENSTDCHDALINGNYT